MPGTAAGCMGQCTPRRDLGSPRCQCSQPRPMKHALTSALLSIPRQLTDHPGRVGALYQPTLRLITKLGETRSLRSSVALESPIRAPCPAPVLSEKLNWASDQEAPRQDLNSTSLCIHQYSWACSALSRKWLCEARKPSMQF